MNEQLEEIIYFDIKRLPKNVTTLKREIIKLKIKQGLQAQKIKMQRDFISIIEKELS